MVDIAVRAMATASASVRTAIRGYPRIGKFLALPDEKFGSIIRELEKDLLFQILRSKRIVTFSGIRKLTDAERSMVSSARGTDRDGKEAVSILDIIPSHASFDTESFLSDHEDVIDVLKKIGRDQFVQILRSDDDRLLAHVCGKYDLSRDERERLVGCINDFQVKDAVFSQTSETPLAQQLMSPGSQTGIEKYTTIGAIALRKGKYFPELNAVYERRKYAIRKHRLACLEKELDDEAKARMRSMLSTIEFINMRRSTIYHIIELVCEAQKEYLRSAGTRPLVPFTQKDAALILNVCPSTINRVIGQRRISMPWGEAKPVKDLFATQDGMRKETVKKLVTAIVKREPRDRPYSDEAIRDKLKDLFRVGVSREAIKQYRGELGIPASHTRKIEEERSWLNRS